MPMIGRLDQSDGANPYRQIQMKQKSPEELLKENGLGSKEFENLNKITGSNKALVSQKTKNQLGKDEFLRLLTHQLQHQDPMNPMDQNKFAADLAQFSQLEQLTNMHTLMEKNDKGKVVENKFYAANFLGKKVTTSGNSINYPGDGSEMKLNYTLGKDAQRVLIKIFDKTNNLIGQIENEKVSRGMQSVPWEGKSLDGGIAGPGRYTFQVQAWDYDFRPIEIQAKTKGTINGVEFDQDQILFLVDNKKITLEDVDSFELPTSDQTTASSTSMPKILAPPAAVSDISQKVTANKWPEKTTATEFPVKANSIQRPARELVREFEQNQLLNE